MLARCLRKVLIFAAVVAAPMGLSAAQDTEVKGSPGRCAICGRPGPCQQKVCRIECGTEKIKKHYWCVEAVDVCTMLPTHPGRLCDPGCGECGQQGCDIGCDSCAQAARPSGWLAGLLYDLGHQKPCPVPPQAGRVRSVKKLVKKEYEVEVPVYRSVVQYVCAECLAAQACGVCAAPEGEPATPSPGDAKPEPSPEKAAPSESTVKPAPTPVEPMVMLAPLPPM